MDKGSLHCLPSISVDTPHRHHRSSEWRLGLLSRCTFECTLCILINIMIDKSWKIRCHSLRLLASQHICTGANRIKSEYYSIIVIIIASQYVWCVHVQIDYGPNVPIVYFENQIVYGRIFSEIHCIPIVRPSTSDTLRLKMHLSVPMHLHTVVVAGHKKSLVRQTQWYVYYAVRTMCRHIVHSVWPQEIIPMPVWPLAALK